MREYEIVRRLRDSDATAHEEAADLLEFLLSRFESHSMQMNGDHSYRFTTGWPWKYAKGPTIEAALKAAIVEQKRGMAEMAAWRERK
jgi:hypothetical protein